MTFYFLMLNGSGDCSGGIGRETGLKGEDGTISGKPCPRGLHGLFCEVSAPVLDHRSNFFSLLGRFWSGYEGWLRGNQDLFHHPSPSFQGLAPYNIVIHPFLAGVSSWDLQE